ncbi:MAG: RuBisCO large subunit C-terminal-like domain-containing protein [Betaproteobacteria bacterium]
MSPPRFVATYAVRADAAHVEARALTLALEQSVEVPLAAVRDARVLAEVVARVVSVDRREDGRYDVRVSLAFETAGRDAGQLLNMLFGNSSLHDDVELFDVEWPREAAETFRGPRFGITGWREMTGAFGRPLTCSALKPLGLSPQALASLAATLAGAGIDVIKDDHGLADQASAPFAARVAAVQRAIDAANRSGGGSTIYAPSVTGDADAMRAQIRVARDCGVRALLAAPMVSGVSMLAALARDAGMPILAHPSLAGVARIAPPLLLGKLFRLFGADATIFPNAGGRFGYSRETCAAIAHAARESLPGLAPALPVAAGGMSVARVPDMLATFGDDAMLLVGGDLLVESGQVEARCRAFVAAVREAAEVS